MRESAKSQETRAKWAVRLNYGAGTLFLIAVFFCAVDGGRIAMWIDVPAVILTVAAAILRRGGRS